MCRTRRAGRWRVLLFCALLFSILLGAPRSAAAFDVNGGISAGGMLAGIVPRLALSPHAGVAWRWESGLLLEVHGACVLLPVGSRLGIGFNGQASAAIGYASERGTVSAGPSLSLYSMPACGHALCGRVVGLAPGVQAEASYYLGGGFFGLSIQANIAWMGGQSEVWSGGVAAMVVAGPVLRWRSV